MKSNKNNRNINNKMQDNIINGKLTWKWWRKKKKHNNEVAKLLITFIKIWMWPLIASVIIRHIIVCWPEFKKNYICINKLTAQIFFFFCVKPSPIIYYIVFNTILWYFIRFICICLPRNFHMEPVESHWNEYNVLL